MFQNKLQLKKILSNRSYVFFWLSSSFSMMASNLIQFVLSLYVLDKTGSATIFASMLSIIIFPRLLFAPIAGVFGDRIKKLDIMKVVCLFSCIYLTIYYIKSKTGGGLSITSIYILVILLEISEIFYQVAEGSILPEIIPKELLSEAVSLAKIDDGIVYVASPAIGSLIYIKMGAEGGLLATNIMFFFCFLMTLFINTPFYKKRDKNKIKINEIFVGFREGVRIIGTNEFLKRFVLIVPIFNFFFTSVYSVTIAHIILVTLDIGEALYGLYRSITSSMVIIVPVLAMRVVKNVPMPELVRKSALLVSLVLLVTGVAVFAYYLIGTPIKYYVFVLLTILDCFVISTMMPVHMSTSIFYQAWVPDEFRSRVLSIRRMLSVLTISLGNMIFGFLTDIFQGYISIFIAAIGTFLCYILYKNAFKHLTSEYEYS